MPDLLPMTITSRPSPSLVKAGDDPKSKSGPGRSPQFASPTRQPKMSGAATCFAQRSLPVLRSNAATALVAGCVAVPAYVLPTPTYSAPRLRSIVGADQMAPPAGPQDWPPSARLPSTLAGSAMVYARHTTLPLFASSATTLPRNVQQAYVGLFPASSYDEVGT